MRCFKALEKVFNGEPFPAFLEAASGVANTPAGKTTVTQFNLPAGEYFAACSDTGTRRLEEGRQAPLRSRHVRESHGHRRRWRHAPTADATITAKDYSFTLNGLKAGEQTVAFKNDGPTQWHFGDIQVFPKGTTVEEATDAVNKLITSNGPPPAGVPQPEEVTSLQIASPGMGNTLPVTLQSGRTYVIMCFVSDLAGGLPHAIGKHMYKVFTVS